MSFRKVSKTIRLLDTQNTILDTKMHLRDGGRYNATVMTILSMACHGSKSTCTVWLRSIIKVIIKVTEISICTESASLEYVQEI